MLKSTLKTLMAASILATAPLAAWAAGHTEFTLRATANSNENDEDYDGLVVFKNHVELASNGRIAVEIFMGTQLCGNGTECTQGVADGNIDVYVSTSGGFAGIFPYVQVFDLPYLMADDRVAEAALENGTPFMDLLQSKVLEDSGEAIRLMTIGNTGGWRNFANTKGRVTQPSDMDGLKVRTVVADIPQELVKALGGAPTPIPWPELFTSLQTGVVEGSKNGITDIMGMKFPEAGLQYVTLDGHAYMGALWIMNNEKLQAMPADLQRVVADGFYQLPTNLDGELALRTRVPYYRDQTIDVSFNADEAVKLNINLEAMESDEEISNSLPSVFHFNQIEFDQDPDSVLSRSGFQRDCAGCHQFGNEFTRMDREGGLWSATIRRMHGYMGNADAELIARRSALLDLDGPYGEPVRERPQITVIPEMPMEKIYEYPLKDVIFPHDAEISEVDGLSYSVDRLGDAMVITDMQTGKSVYVKMPDPLRPAVENANGYTSRSFKPGPHSLAMGTDELWYTTNATSDEIGVFDPKTQSWVKSYIVPEPARYPHTVRIGADGIVWFTLAGSEQVGRLDPQTGDVQLIDLPQRKPVGIAGATTPYGIDISSVDGKVWYARLYGDAIGYVDPETLKVTEYDSPVRGPRRLRFDKSGQLWVTGYTDGVIAQIKPDAMDIKVHKMPEFEKDHRPAPYSLAIHPVTQEVWINETMNDRVYRYIPAEDRFLSYPMP